jgi:hypothetical protein
MAESGAEAAPKRQRVNAPAGRAATTKILAALKARREPGAPAAGPEGRWGRLVEYLAGGCLWEARAVAIGWLQWPAADVTAMLQGVPGPPPPGVTEGELAAPGRLAGLRLLLLELLLCGAPSNAAAAGSDVALAPLPGAEQPGAVPAGGLVLLQRVAPEGGAAHVLVRPAEGDGPDLGTLTMRDLPPGAAAQATAAGLRPAGPARSLAAVLADALDGEASGAPEGGGWALALLERFLRVAALQLGSDQAGAAALETRERSELLLLMADLVKPDDDPEVVIGLYVTSQYSSTTLFQVSYHIQ